MRLDMKKITLLAGVFLGALSLGAVAATDNDAMGQMMHHSAMRATADKRISLGLDPIMQQHQLSNMREHVKAIQSIVGLLSEGDFVKASQVAHSKLGLTEDMKQMCGMFNNKDFRNLGLDFHKSGDELGDVLQTKDLNKSLQALHRTMQYCVQCHETYRQ